ncbi:hypothetical protein A3C21_02910 [Candidatus Kaiserbacteria bacterium RIFCSPHIGHO2_02_FULL_59_21]|uniref:Pyrrolo-quinoline quinone repeat domain-containing protein n=2 Tax=Candidatus Kaiseribacteriota TaxID=1752734 RepID=A0A1F6DYT7_9BACT|nr:MAG: hypothetical protein A2766_04030 [Candidatus Kaiserbacteria bacterium RIFCSPHIGHO2_01_FULL_58_22]OGG66614.1 MAG: hypothetical protein A3C21_02910 [Candidatus Kaiserbacteria bacterium RIFCSPHIGHO2_02_FULL_59_21]OGG79011.1 MAG: hypothetical protein A2952_01445 [Candidatus Kaiserbacteria bacterium RIFCSPLOWO2_01_FULL_59_34]
MMKPAEREERRARLKRAIETLAFVRGDEAPHVSRSGKFRESGWLFDIRNVILRSEALDDSAALFWETFGGKNVQIGSIESAGIALVSGLVAHAAHRGEPGASGFYIRKSRKKDGLLKMVEGDIDPRKKIVLVDDVINSGKSFMRQIEVLESLGRKPEAVWMLVRFRDTAYYEYFREKGIPIHSVFELDDFKDTLGTKNLAKKEPPPPPRQAFYPVWKFASEKPSYQHVVPKSDPALDEKRVYMGSDAGVFWALEQSDGSIAWSYKVGLHPKGKGIFSSPVLHEGIVYFGAYDGNVYALDAETGKKKWVSFEADWIGSSPALAPELGLLFIGLEYGLWRKRGGIAALDMKTGKTVWAYRDMPTYTHSSPLYIEKHWQVVIGSNDGAAYLFDANNGTLLWKFETRLPTEKELDSGFSAHDIKESFAYDAKRDLVVFANAKGFVFFVDRTSGKERGMFAAEFGFYSTPLVYENSVFVSSLDKHLYCIDLDTFQEKWRWLSGARIFASPTLIDGSIYIGSNSGRLTEIDPATGEERSFLTLTERITNKPVKNQKTQRFFVPTYANEIYCMERANIPSVSEMPLNVEGADT